MPRIRSERPAFDLKYPELAPGASREAPPPGGAPLSGDKQGGGAAYPEPEDQEAAEQGR
jgi:cytochrome c oxidase subunit 1